MTDVYRPTLAAARRTKLIAALKRGLSRKGACAAARLPRRTFYAWLEQGEPDPETGEYPDDFFGQLAADVAAAEAHVEDVDLKTIADASQEGNWQAAAWRLERRFPDDYSRTERSKVELTGKDGGPMEVIERASRDLDSRLDSLASRIAAGAGTPSPRPDAG